MRRPVLSVVIPTWNRSQLVCEAIESALAQRPGAVEVIVVDDASTDDTVGVLARRFGSRIKLLRKYRRGGVGGARNAGARAAAGELVTFLDSDDVLLPGKLDAELCVLESLPDADVVFSNNLFFTEGRQEEQSRFVENGLLTSDQESICWMSECPSIWTTRSPVSTCAMTLRRSVIARLGDPLYAEDLLAQQDWELEIRILHECRVAVLPGVWSHVRQFDDDTRPDRVMPGKQRTPAQQIKFLRARLEVLDRSLRLPGFSRTIINELESSRLDTVNELDRYEKP